jgi:hypothetical protein
MAHFAELESKTDPTGFTSDTHLVVKRVVVVGNDISAGGGTLGDNDCHADGETWCVNFFGGGTWKQTSYNNNFRKQYAGLGDVYDPSKNKFIIPQPYASWSLDGNDDWQAPVTRPNANQADGYRIFWDEDNTRWISIKLSDDSNHRWDADNTQWVSI